MAKINVSYDIHNNNNYFIGRLGDICFILTCAKKKQRKTCKANGKIEAMLILEYVSCTDTFSSWNGGFSHH